MSSHSTSSLRLPIAFSVTVFTSASLLFLVQPMVAKMLLPLFGGAASVWNTCLVFYQGTLLLGYLHAHLISRRLSLRGQVAVHAGLLALAFLLLPIRIAGVAGGEGHPVTALLAQLAVGVGLPFFALSATGTLLQSWFARTTHPATRDPYFLYAASNLGSLLALVAYPVWMEPRLALVEQSRVWASGFGVLAALVTGCGALALESEAPAVERRAAAAILPSARDRVGWTLLALMPSGLMMSVTLHLTTDIAPVPLLWIIPLCLYLLAFILAFARLPPGVLVWAGRAAGPVLMLLLFYELSEFRYPMIWAIALQLANFFLLALVFLGKLSALRPDPAHLTEFYLWISLGGVIGGVLNSLVAPVLFTVPIEYLLFLLTAAVSLRAVRLPSEAPRPARPALELALAGAVVAFTVWVLHKPLPLLNLVDLSPLGAPFGWPRWRITTVFDYALPLALCWALDLARRRLAFGVALVVVALFCTWDNQQIGETVVKRARSFFSVLKVTDDGGCRHLFSGRTPHGRQFKKDEERQWPLAFYSRKGPVGDVFRELTGPRQPKEVAVVGLGTGSIAAYGVPGMRMTYYEIDPEVVAIAQDPALFTYLADSHAKIEVLTGDARLRMGEARPAQFDVILVDAFSSDAIPVHLLTKEAIRLYLDKLAPDGLLALHISNRYLELMGLCGRLAQDAGLSGRIRGWSGFDGWGRVSTRWVVLARREALLGELNRNPLWKELPVPPETPLWTDESSNLWSVFQIQ